MIIIGTPMLIAILCLVIWGKAAAKVMLAMIAVGLVGLFLMFH